MTSTISTCSPVYSTPRTPHRPTDGAAAARVAAALGVPFIPWQSAWADVLGERLPNGRLAYPRAVMVVPRRAGKSVTGLAIGLGRGGYQRRHRAVYAGDRRETASALWRTEWFPLVDDSPTLSKRIHLRRGNGSESFTWRRGGSTLRLLPNDGNAMRSAASKLALLDEARLYPLDVGLELESGIFPTQATGGGGQTIIISNAGTEESQWLKRWVELGRTAVLDGRTDAIAHLEFAAPLDADPADPATWYAAHPGLGFHVDVEAIAADQAVMTPDTFAAEYLGWWPETLVDSKLVDGWLAGLDTRAVLDGPIVFALELDEDRTTASIVAAASDGDRTVVELIDHRPHGAWVGPRLHQLAEDHNTMAVVYDAAGPAAALGPDLATIPARIIPARTNLVTAAAGWFHDLATGAPPRIVHRDDPEMTLAVSKGRRRRASGAWLFDRRQPEACPLIAATLATFVLADATLRRPGVT